MSDHAEDGRLAQWWSSLSSTAQDRVVGAVLSSGAVPVLVIARMLEPSPAGVGTHKQLGLGGCTILTATGWPCPMCGMTTTFSHLAHFEVLDAARTQPFGLVLFAVTVALAVYGVLALGGVGLWRRGLAWVLAREVPIAAGILIGMVVGWVYKAAVMGLL